jgi:hypothetical protein
LEASLSLDPAVRIDFLPQTRIPVVEDLKKQLVISVQFLGAELPVSVDDHFLTDSALEVLLTREVT